MDTQHPYCILPHIRQLEREAPEQSFLHEWQYGSFVARRVHPRTVSEVAALFHPITGHASLPANLVTLIGKVATTPGPSRIKSGRRAIFHLLLHLISQVAELEYLSDVIMVEWFCAILIHFVSKKYYSLEEENQTLHLLWGEHSLSDFEGASWNLGSKISLSLRGPSEDWNILLHSYLMIQISLRCLTFTDGRFESSSSEPFMLQNVMDLDLDQFRGGGGSFERIPNEEWGGLAPFDVQFGRGRPNEVNQVIANFTLVRFRQPQNRLCQMLGSQRVCTISFSAPQLNVENDILNGEELPFVTKEEFGLHLLCAKHGLNSNDMNRLFRYERFSVNDRLFALKEMIMQCMWVGSVRFRPLACNITGTLTSKYVYSSVDEAVVCSGVFDDYRQVVDPKKPMVVALRLGLLNSTVIPTVSLQESQWSLWIDVKSKSGHMLTDGSGQISSKLAHQVFEAYQRNWFGKLESNPSPHEKAECCRPVEIESGGEEHPSWISPNLPCWDHFATAHPGYCPSAFQIRYRGFKGVLVVVPETNEDGSWIKFSESMLKFRSTPRDSGEYRMDNDTLYICGISCPARPVTLSSELVYLFDSACPMSQRSALLGYLKRMAVTHRSDCGGQGITSLLSLRSPESEQYLQKRWLHSLDVQIARNLGIRATSHFLSHVIRLSTFMPNSAHIYGVADHHGVLAPNQVFVQVTQPNGTSQIITGPLIMTKTPALRPEDLCRFNAVDHPSLRHLRDVVVFSTRSEVSPASCMASADLDGDQFYVMWDAELVEFFPTCPSLPETEPYPYRPSNQLMNAPPLHYDNWQSHFRDTLVKALIAPANNTEVCALSHLLCLRRLYLDLQPSEWSEAVGSSPLNIQTFVATIMPRWHVSVAQEEKQLVCDQLARWLQQTFEAPKHGNWVEWTQVRQFLRQHLRFGSGKIILPAVPHYSTTSTFRARNSTSLFGQLYDELMAAIGPLCADCASHPHATALDYLIQFELTMLQHRKDSKHFERWLEEQINQCKQFFCSKSQQCRSCTLRWSAFVQLVGGDTIMGSNTVPVSASLLHRLGMQLADGFEDYGLSLAREESVQPPEQHVHVSWRDRTEDSNIYATGTTPELEQLSASCMILTSLSRGSLNPQLKPIRYRVAVLVLHYVTALLIHVSRSIDISMLLGFLRDLAPELRKFGTLLDSLRDWMEIPPSFSFLNLLAFRHGGPPSDGSSGTPDFPTWLRATCGNHRWNPEVIQKIEKLYYALTATRKLATVEQYHPETHQELAAVLNSSECMETLSSIPRSWMDYAALKYPWNHLFVRADRNPVGQRHWILATQSIGFPHDYIQSFKFVDSVIKVDLNDHPFVLPFVLREYQSPPQAIIALSFLPHRNDSCSPDIRSLFTENEKSEISHQLITLHQALSAELMNLNRSFKPFYLQQMLLFSAAGIDASDLISLAQRCKRDEELRWDRGAKGPLPASIGSSSFLHLQHISIGNQLTGSIPKEIGNLTNLGVLCLRGNQLSGSIPQEIGSKLWNLTVIELQRNHLEGTIPSTFGNLRYLKELNLSHNRLSGPIPKELGRLQVLSRIDLSCNQLTGSIPAEFGGIRRLLHLDVSCNQLSGPIPRTLGNLIGMQYFMVHHNRLNGCIPPELQGWVQPVRIDLSYNQLTGCVPRSLAGHALCELVLSNNPLSGAIPREFGMLRSLKLLDISSTQLHSPFSALHNSDGVVLSHQA